MTLRERRAGSALIVFAVFTSIASAQVVNPATAQKPPEQEAQKAEPGELHSWELPATVVREKRWSELREEDLVGEYSQPRWTAHRRFPSTRVYVAPAGQIEFEYWVRQTIPREGPTKTENMYEWEIGLGGRFQLDLYMVNTKEGNDGPSGFDQQKTELRYALADWGKIPANPTLYFEVVTKDQEPTVLEYKLLLGDEMAPSWHWGTNFVVETETGGSREVVRELTAGISKTLRDERLSIGAEMKAALIDTHDDRGNYEEELLLGPSLQFRPQKRIHIDFAPLIGIGAESPAAQLLLVLGYEF